MAVREVYGDWYGVDYVRSKDVGNFFTHFLDSKEVGIGLIRKNTIMKRKNLQRKDLLRKCVVFII